MYNRKKFYRLSFSAFSNRRNASSFRRYHRQRPCFSACTRPARVSTCIWCEIVGCESCMRSSTSQAHSPVLRPSEQHPFSFRKARMRRRAGSATAPICTVNESLVVFISTLIYISLIDACQYIVRGAIKLPCPSGLFLQDGIVAIARQPRFHGLGVGQDGEGPHLDVE